MPSTFRDYLKDLKLPVSENEYQPTVRDSDHFTGDNETLYGKYLKEKGLETVHTPELTGDYSSTGIKSKEFVNKYIGDDSVKKLNQTTPIVGNIVSQIESIKDSWTREKANWKTLISGLKNISNNPNAAYYVANALMRYIKGPVEVLPYNQDLDTSNLIVKLADNLGLGNLLTSLGIGTKGGGPYTKRDYTNAETVKNVSTEGGNLLTKTKDGITSKGSTTETGDTNNTKKYVEGINNIPLFSVDYNGGFRTPFSAEQLLGKENLSLQDIKIWVNNAGEYRNITPQWNWNLFGSEGENGINSISDPAAAKKFLNYVYNQTPYTAYDYEYSSGPMGNVMYALHVLDALHGYEPYSHFSPRNDNIWSIKLYPYSPGYPYWQNDRNANEEYYAGTLTPQLPISYIPTWAHSRNNGVDSYTLGLFEFDWERYTPVQSYQLGFGQLQSKNIPLFNGNLRFPVDFEYNMFINLTILDDVDATFTKYMSYYFNRTIDRNGTARAPIEYSAFVVELTIFKPALKVNFQFKFIAVPVEYDYNFEGSESDSTAAGLQTLNMHIIGMINPTHNMQVEGLNPNILKNDISHLSWNKVTLKP